MVSHAGHRRSRSARPGPAAVKVQGHAGWSGYGEDMGTERCPEVLRGDG
ncbi:hypothetical protein PLANTIT3_61235 [Plantibacter sp. T3]|nr:hypothetical protein PLANTIT3_61235 [Plantibacter sp. T3]